MTDQEAPDLLDVLDEATGDHARTVKILEALMAAGYGIVSVQTDAVERAKLTLLGMFGPEFPAVAMMMSLAEQGIYLAARPELRHDLISQPDGSLLATHPPDRCEGRHCVIHNPSDHPLKDAPIYWNGVLRRTDRVCSHNQFHPDPDHLSYVFETFGVVDWMAHKQHRCDGCCKVADMSKTDTEGNRT